MPCSHTIQPTRQLARRGVRRVEWRGGGWGGWGILRLQTPSSGCPRCGRRCSAGSTVTVFGNLADGRSKPTTASGGCSRVSFAGNQWEAAPKPLKPPTCPAVLPVELKQLSPHKPHPSPRGPTTRMDALAAPAAAAAAAPTAAVPKSVERRERRERRDAKRAKVGRCCSAATVHSAVCSVCRLPSRCWQDQPHTQPQAGRRSRHPLPCCPGTRLFATAPRHAPNSVPAPDTKPDLHPPP